MEPVGSSIGTVGRGLEVGERDRDKKGHTCNGLYAVR